MVLLTLDLPHSLWLIACFALDLDYSLVDWWPNCLDSYHLVCLAADSS